MKSRQATAGAFGLLVFSGALIGVKAERLGAANAAEGGSAAVGTEAAEADRLQWLNQLQEEMADAPPLLAAEPALDACPADKIAWERSRMITLCVSPCETDADCRDDERCRVISQKLAPEMPAVLAEAVDDEVLVPGDATAEEAEQMLEAVETAASDNQAIRACDAFAAEHGALSAVGREPRRTPVNAEGE